MGKHTIYTFADGSTMTHGEIAEKVGLHHSSIDHRVKMIKTGVIPESDLFAKKRSTQGDKIRGQNYTRPSQRAKFRSEKHRKDQPTVINGWLMP